MRELNSQNPSRCATRLRWRYDQLWRSAFQRIRRNQLEIDPVLQARVPDKRRGLTLVARPGPVVRKRIVQFFRELRRLEPEQYYYKSSQLHVTILSLFTATVDWKPFFRLKGKYVQAVDSFAREIVRIPIRFEGITASPGTVMIQGFFDSVALNSLRDQLRRELRCRGLDQGGLDERYRLETAHMTALRFRAPLRQSQQFAAALAEGRTLSFGEMRVETLFLVSHDWYMSQTQTRVLKRYSVPA